MLWPSQPCDHGYNVVVTSLPAYCTDKKMMLDQDGSQAVSQALLLGAHPLNVYFKTVLRFPKPKLAICGYLEMEGQEILPWFQWLWSLSLVQIGVNHGAIMLGILSMLLLQDCDDGCCGILLLKQLLHAGGMGLYSESLSKAHCLGV